MQQQIKIEGSLAECPGCKSQPKHYLWHGKDVHFIECAPCGTRTPSFPTFNEAVEYWERQQVSHIRGKA